METYAAPPDRSTGDRYPAGLGIRSLALLGLVLSAGCTQERPATLDTRAYAARTPQTAAERAPRPAPIWRGSTTLTLPQLLAAADEVNPEIRAERMEVDVATAAIWEARLYPNPTLLLEYEDLQRS